MIKLIKSNIHKDRSVLIAFMLIMIISSAILEISLFLGVYDKRYDRITEEMNTGDGVSFFYGDSDTVRGIMEDMSEVESFNIIDIILPADMTFTLNGSDKEKKFSDVMYFDVERYASFEDFFFVEKDDSISSDFIYLNVYTAYYNGIGIGDVMHLHSDNFGEYDLTVAGIYEDFMAGNPYSYLSAIVDDDTYGMIKNRSDELEASGAEFANRRFMNYTFAEGVSLDDGVMKINDTLNARGIPTDGYAASLAKAGYVSALHIISAFMTSLAVIIMVICLIMMVFTVNNNIDRDIRNIGALRAVGYTVSNIRAALCLEFMGLGVIGTVMGIGLSYAMFPVLEKSLIRQISGMIWEKRFYPELTFSLVAAYIMIVPAVVFLATARIKKLHPATALRFGLASNSFRKNHIPLSETKGSLNLLMGLKSSLQNMNQNLIIFGILAAVSFMTVFSGVLFYNTRIDMTDFQTMLQGDSPDAYIYITYKDDEELNEIIEIIGSMDEVTEVYGLSGIDGAAYVGGYDSNLLYSDRPEFVNCGIYEGVMVREDNEAVLGSITAEKAGVGIGDEVEVKVGDRTERFLVTGLQQAVYGFGERIYLSEGGARRLGIDPEYTYLRVRITDPDTESVDRFIDRAESLLGSRFTDSENHFRETRSSDNVPVYVVGLVVLIIVIINIIVVMVVIRLLLKTVFIKREKEFGILKSVGFTGDQLRLQLSISLLPTSIAASLAGAVLGHFLINPLFKIVFGSFGIMQSTLIMKPVLILLSSLAVCLLVFFFSFILSGRMKKVAPYVLIQE